MYLTLELESPEHGDQYGKEETQEEVSWCSGCSGYVKTGEGCEHDNLLKAKPELRTLICSCGSKTCYAIGSFGLSNETYEREIRPLGSQYEKDKRAAQLKAEGLT